MIKNILSIIKPNELENYAKEISQHNFFELFSEEQNELTKKSYTTFLYFGEIESKAYSQDYMLFFSKVYPNQTINKENYFSVFDEFKAYLEHDDVYFKYKTLQGSMYLNPNCDLIDNLLKNAFITADYLPITTKKKYYFPFFEYLEGKVLESHTIEEIALERLESEDLMYIQEVFMDKITLENPPFYLNPKNKTYKYSRQMIVNQILPMTHNERAYIAGQSDKIVGIIFASEIKEGKVEFTIMTDTDYMDSEFSKVIECLKILYKDKCQTIIIKNINRVIASSNLNTACVLAHCKTDYDKYEQIDGYTQYNQVYKYNDQDEIPNFTPQNIVNFLTSHIK